MSVSVPAYLWRKTAASGFSSLDELCDDCVGEGISGEGEGQG
jgi:hypothetical protein